MANSDIWMKKNIANTFFFFLYTFNFVIFCVYFLLLYVKSTKKQTLLSPHHPPFPFDPR